MMNERIRIADMALLEAEKALCIAVECAYPEGSVIKVQIGRSKFDFKVTGYGSWWAGPGRLKGLNTKTGKAREIHHSQIIEGESHDE